MLSESVSECWHHFTNSSNSISASIRKMTKHHICFLLIPCTYHVLRFWKNLSSSPSSWPYHWNHHQGAGNELRTRPGKAKPPWIVWFLTGEKRGSPWKPVAPHLAWAEPVWEARTSSFCRWPQKFFRAGKFVGKFGRVILFKVLGSCELIANGSCTSAHLFWNVTSSPFSPILASKSQASFIYLSRRIVVQLVITFRTLQSE